MLDRFIDWLWEVLDSIPSLLGADEPHSDLFRALAALLLILLFVYLMARRPFGGLMRRLFGRSKDEKR
jgi:hypothetical protein